MVVRVQLFGPEAELLGRSFLDVQLADEPTCAALLDKLRRLQPGLGGRIAVNHAFAPHDHVIRDGDEVALIGLVSGG